MNDHDFDAFFRKAAEQYRAPYQPGAWEKMRRKLYPPKGGWSSSTKIMGGIVLLLLISGSVSTVLWYDTPAENALGNQTLGSEQRSTAKKNQSDSSVSSTAQQTPILKSKTKNEVIFQPENSVVIRGDKQSTDPAGFTLAELQVSSETWMAPITSLSQQPLHQKSTEAVIPSRLWQTVADTTEVYPVDQKESFGRNIRWRIGLGVSPDISAINLGKASQVGSKMTITLERFIVPRLSVQTGIIFSNKIYTADGKSYKPYPGYWKEYRVPNSIDARCDVLDIPINLRYYAINRPRNRVFISSGLSSYLMLAEDYVYQYRGGYGRKPYSYEHIERNKNQHYFKVVNASLGYERLLSKRWAIQVEPFVKIPVAGVGFGKIRLSTAGMFFSLNYQLR